MPIQHAIASILQHSKHPLRVQATFPKVNPLQLRVAFFKPVHATRARSDQPGPNHGTFTAKLSSHHVHVTLSWPRPSLQEFNEIHDSPMH